MKKSFATLFLLIGILSVILSFVAFGSDVGYFEYNETYGGDAYTGIQNAAAQTARNVKFLAEAVTFSSGSILLVIGLTLIVYGLKKLLSAEDTNINFPSLYETTQTIEQPAESIARPASPDAHTADCVDRSSAAEGFWVCKACGAHNKTNYGQCKKCGKYRSS